MKPAHWREARQNGRLIGFRCVACGYVSFPERKRTCKRCGAAPAEFEEVQMKPHGQVVSYVIQERLPAGFQTPLPLAVIDLEDGARVVGMIAECAREQLHIGMAVEADLRVLYEDEGFVVHSYKFVPRRSS